MYHVVLISENRILLKRIYEMLEDPSLFRIQIVPFSMDAFEVFYQNHADIIILDTTVFLPFEHILEQIYQCQWSFHVLLVFHEVPPAYIKKDNMFLLETDNLSIELFHEIMEHISKNSSSLKGENTDIIFNWNGKHSVSIHPDTYHTLVIKTFGESSLNSSGCNNLMEKAHPFCNLHLIHTADCMAVFYINRSQIKKEFNFTQLSSIIFEILGHKTALFYEENIPWKKLQSVFDEIAAALPLIYFLQGESKSFHELKYPVYLPSLKDLKDQILLLLSYLLDLDMVSAKHILQDMYFHTIKLSTNLSIREYIRLQLQIIYFLFYQEKIILSFDSAEEELSWLLTSRLFVPMAYSSPRQKDTIKQCILTIYKEYQTTISLDGVAGMLSLNKIYLNRIIKNQFYKTIAEILQLLRMQEAKYLLIFTEKKVSAIASDAGFNDAGYFIKVFRKTTGYSALEFRSLKDNQEVFKKNYESIMEI